RLPAALPLAAPSLHRPRPLQGVIVGLHGVVVGVLEGEVQVPGPCQEAARARLAVAASRALPGDLLGGSRLDGDGQRRVRGIGAAHGAPPSGPAPGTPSSSRSIPSAACRIWRESFAAMLER